VDLNLIVLPLLPFPSLLFPYRREVCGLAGSFLFFPFVGVRSKKIELLSFLFPPFPPYGRARRKFSAGRSCRGRPSPPSYRYCTRISSPPSCAALFFPPSIGITAPTPPPSPSPQTLVFDRGPHLPPPPSLPLRSKKKRMKFRPPSLSPFPAQMAFPALRLRSTPSFFSLEELEEDCFSFFLRRKKLSPISPLDGRFAPFFSSPPWSNAYAIEGNDRLMRVKTSLQPGGRRREPSLFFLSSTEKVGKDKRTTSSRFSFLFCLPPTHCSLDQLRGTSPRFFFLSSGSSGARFIFFFPSPVGFFSGVSGRTCTSLLSFSFRMCWGR